MIESFSFGRIEIDGKAYTSDLIITPEGILENWRRKQGHSLHPEDIREVIEKTKPARFIMGCGANNALQVPASTRQWIESRGTTLIDLPTAEAVETYNKEKEKGKIVAGLHLTC